MFNYSVGVRVGVVRWNVCHLPIRSASVDVIVTDMVRVCEEEEEGRAGSGCVVNCHFLSTLVPSLLERSKIKPCLAQEQE